jgi:hypothetical protein
MSRTWPIALIVIAVVVIGVFAADTLGIIRVPTLLGYGDEQQVSGDPAVEPEEPETVEPEPEPEPEPQPQPRPRRRRPRKPPPKKEAPAPKPAPKRPRFVMPTPASITTSKLPPEVSRDSIHVAIHRQEDAFQRCLKQAIARKDKLPSRVLVSMTASPPGTVTENHIKDPAVERSLLGRCVLRRAGSVRVPVFSRDPITIAFPLTVVKD